MTVTTRRPMLDGTTVTDKHERVVTVRLADTEPVATGEYRRNVEIRFEPRALRLVWQGSPAQLRVVSLRGPELTKAGKANARGLTASHGYLRFELAEDTPDWIRELIDQYTPDWPELPGVPA